MDTISRAPCGRNFIEFLGHFAIPKDLQKQINEIHYASPIGVSGMLDPNLTGVKPFEILGHSFIEIGPVTLRKQNQSPPQLHKDHEEVWFHSQYEKPHLEQVINKLDGLKMTKPIMIRIDPNANPIEVREIIDSLHSVASSFVLTKEQIILVKDVLNESKPIYAQLHSYNSTIDHIKPYISGVLINPPYEKNEEETHFKETNSSLDNLLKIVFTLKETYPNLSIITRGGIKEPKDALKLHETGANLMLLETGYVFSGPGLPKRVHELITNPMKEKTDSGWKWGALFGTLILLGGIIALIFSMTSVILPYDEEFIGLTREEIIAINPRILAFMAHDRMTLAGTMISGGIIYIQLARYGLRYHIHWATKSFHTAAIIGFLGIFLFIGYGYFDWLHGLFWVILLPFYVTCFWKTRAYMNQSSSVNEANTTKWKRSLMVSSFL